MAVAVPPITTSVACLRNCRRSTSSAEEPAIWSSRLSIGHAPLRVASSIIAKLLGCQPSELGHLECHPRSTSGFGGVLEQQSRIRKTRGQPGRFGRAFLVDLLPASVAARGDFPARAIAGAHAGAAGGRFFVIQRG